MGIARLLSPTAWARAAKAMGLFRTKPVDQLTGEGEDNGHKLKRELGPIDAISLGIACIIGTGIFVLPGAAAAAVGGPGPSIILSFVVSGLACFFVMYCYLELTGMISKGGSAYTYASATLGELVAWIIGWDLLLEYAIGGSAVAAGWSAYLQNLLIHAAPAVNSAMGSIGLHTDWTLKLPAYLASAPKDMPWSQVLVAAGGLTLGAIFLLQRSAAGAFKWVMRAAGAVAVYVAFAYGLIPAAQHITSIDVPAIAIIVVISLMLMWGVKQTARATSIFVIVKLAVIALFIGVGVWHIDTANYHPFMVNGLSGVFVGAIPAFFAYIGFDAVSTLPEDCKNPKRDVPIGIAGSLIVSTVLYMAVSAIMVGAVSYVVFRGSSEAGAPMAVVLDHIHVNWAAPFVGVGAIAGITSVLIVLVLGMSRVIMNMSRDGLLSSMFSRLHPRLQTPVWSLAILGTLVALPAGLIPIGELAELTSIGTLFAFMLVCIGVMVLRRTEPNRERRFNVPFAGRRLTIGSLTVQLGDVFPVLGILSSAALMIFGVAEVTWLRFVFWLIAGLVIYFTYSRFHSVLARPSSQVPAAKDCCGE